MKMKNLYLCVLLWMLVVGFVLFVEKANAANWYPAGKLGANTVYMDKDKCEKAEKVECIDVSKMNASKTVIKFIEVDDMNKPIEKSRYNTEYCKDFDSCSDTIAKMICEEGDISMYSENTIFPGYSAYCTRILGYKKKIIKQIVQGE